MSGPHAGADSAASRDAADLHRGTWTIRWRMPGLIGLLTIGAVSGYALRLEMAGSDLRQARLEAGRNSTDRAVAAYQRHLNRFPQDVAARIELAGLVKRRDPEAALRVLRAIPADSPLLTAAARQVAAISLELGRDYDTLGPLLYLQQQLPGDPGIELSLGEIRFRERDYEAALSHAQRCRELDPTLVGAYLLAADALDELRRPKEMAESLEAALQFDPDLSLAHLNLAYAYQALGRQNEAIEHVEWFLKRHPQSASAYRILGMIEQSRGRFTEALAAIQRSLQLQPRNLEAGLLQGELLLTLDRTEDAYQRMTALANDYEDEQRVLTLWIRAAEQSGHTAEAQRHTSRLKRLTTHDE